MDQNPWKPLSSIKSSLKYLILPEKLYLKKKNLLDLSPLRSEWPYRSSFLAIQPPFLKIYTWNWIYDLIFGIQTPKTIIFYQIQSIYSDSYAIQCIFSKISSWTSFDHQTLTDPQTLNRSMKWTFYYTLNLTTIGKYDPEIKSEIIAFYHFLNSERSLIGTMSTVVVWQQSKLKR